MFLFVLVYERVIVIINHASDKITFIQLVGLILNAYKKSVRYLGVANLTLLLIQELHKMNL